MSVSCECCVLSGRGLCFGLITRPEDSYRVWCVWVWWWILHNEEALVHWGLLRHGKIKGLQSKLTYLITYLLNPWNRVLPEKLTDLQLVKKYPVFYGTRRFITVFTRSRYLFLSWASSIQSIPSHPTILNISTCNKGKFTEGIGAMWTSWKVHRMIWGSSVDIATGLRAGWYVIRIPA